MATLLERARSEGTPLVDGERVTFVWEGHRPALLLGEFNDYDPDRAPTLRRAGPRAWSWRTEVPRDAYLEYVWAADRRYDGASDEHRAADPFNPRCKPNGIGGTVQYFYMPDATPTPLVRRRRGVPRGELTRHQVATGGMAEGATRRVALYRPAAAGPYPLLAVLDGNDYLRQAKITAIVDNLIDSGRIAPVALALVWNSPRARFAEYACSEATVEFLLQAVLPLAAERLPLKQRPGAHGVLGPSMAGVMALFLGLRHPDVFGKVYSQAGAFSFDGRDLVVYDLVRRVDPAALEVRIDNGTYDFLFETNRRMADELRRRGYPTTYHEYHAGHNYFAWRDALGAGLEALFPGRR